MTVVVSIATVLVSIVFGFFTALRAQYERVLNVIDYISSDEVAKARHQLGLSIHNNQLPMQDRPERVRDLFTILWAFGRINAVRRTLPTWTRFVGGHGPHKLLKQNTQPWIEYWDNHIEQLVKSLDADITGSAVGVNELVKVWVRQHVR